MCHNGSKQTQQTMCALSSYFNHLIGGSKQRCGDCDVERPLRSLG